MKTKFKEIILLLLVVLSTACKDDETPVPPPNEYISAEVLLEEAGFQGSVLIRKGNTDILRQGFGMARLNENKANEPSLVYRIGSMTKAFTAMGIVNLKRDGLLDSYDQTISEFDDEFPHGDEITVRHLLTHYSGLPDYLGAIEDAAKNEDQYFSPGDIYDLLKESGEEDGLLFEPGSQFSYSNSNYLILGILIEELTEMSYHEYLQSKIFEPLGLTHTTKGEDVIGGEGFAKGYRNGIEVGPYPMQIAYSAGDLVSTVSDLEKWADAMMGSTLLTAAEKADVFAAPYSEDDYFTVGMGWFTITQNGTLIYNHGGNIDGFTSMIALLPETNSVIIILSNVENWEPVNEVLEALIDNEF
jgi:CubicO group peptidase (beta-lactamase class C family)